MDSLCPICDPVGSRYVTCAPWSCAATSNAVRVRVEVFSKDQRDVLACQVLPFVTAVLGGLEIGREPEEELQLLGREVELLEEAPVPKVERHVDPPLPMRRALAPRCPSGHPSGHADG
jgi:hypothetical protein